MNGVLFFSSWTQKGQIPYALLWETFPVALLVICHRDELKSAVLFHKDNVKGQRFYVDANSELSRAAIYFSILRKIRISSQSSRGLWI